MPTKLNTSEHAHTILSVPGRMQRRHKWPESTTERSAGLWSTQTWRSERRTTGYSLERMVVTLRFDDNCKNGHLTFAITCDIYEGTRYVGGGANHGRIWEVFPELRPLIKWHLCSTDGPLHYPTDVLYLAGTKDCYGRRKGEPERWDHVALVGTSPIPHKLPPKFWKWLQQESESIDADILLYTDQTGPIVAIAHPREPESFSPKYTFSEFTDKWHECPFDNVEEAQAWEEALGHQLVTLQKRPTAYSNGKEPELKLARSSAIWLDATDEDLKEEGLEKRLRDRLPALVSEFNSRMSAIGFAGGDE